MGPSWFYAVGPANSNPFPLVRRQILQSLNFRIVGNSESAGINRHVVGDARALQERK
jgi:hypothetical protein